MAASRPVRFLALQLLLLGPAVAAAESPSLRAGTVISAENVAAYEPYLGPAMRWIVQRGYTIRVVAPRTIAPPPAFTEATARYAPDVALSPDRTHVVNHVAGLPFPDVDARQIGDNVTASILTFR